MHKKSAAPGRGQRQGYCTCKYSISEQIKQKEADIKVLCQLFNEQGTAVFINSKGQCFSFDFEDLEELKIKAFSVAGRITGIFRPGIYGNFTEEDAEILLRYIEGIYG